jgi:hypothetical protein
MLDDDRRERSTLASHRTDMRWRISLFAIAAVLLIPIATGVALAKRGPTPGRTNPEAGLTDAEQMARHAAGMARHRESVRNRYRDFLDGDIPPAKVWREYYDPSHWGGYRWDTLEELATDRSVVAIVHGRVESQSFRGSQEGTSLFVIATLNVSATLLGEHRASVEAATPMEVVRNPGSGEWILLGSTHSPLPPVGAEVILFLGDYSADQLLYTLPFGAYEVNEDGVVVVHEGGTDGLAVSGTPVDQFVRRIRAALDSNKDVTPSSQ